MPRRTRAILALAAALAAAALAASCGGGSLTVEEYAEFCADSISATRSIVEADELRWSELEALAARSLERLEGVDPPAELSAFHRAVRRTLEFVAETAADQPPEETVDPLKFGFNAVRIATQFARAVDDLPPDARALLQDAGCV